MKNILLNKRVLVTGACGTVGYELVRQILNPNQIKELIAVDNNESELFFLEQRFQHHKNARFFLADIRDAAKMCRCMRGVDVVFHAAAFKHVILCERSPFEAVQTNILGVQNIISAACKNKVGRVIFTSSDKAVNPTSVMGTSKLMGERLFTAANSNRRTRNTIFASTRFGNVLGSRGSVIPIFREQIRNGRTVTITDSRMTRFIMSIKEAVRLVIDSVMLAKGGEVFVTKMPVIRISDLAEVMIEKLSPSFGHNPEEIQIKIIGTKPGEKIYEELMNDEEIRRSVELERYYAVTPAFRSLYCDISYDYPNGISAQVTHAYNSANETPLTKEQLSKFLEENNLLYEDPSISKHPDERYWPDARNAIEDR